MGASLIERGSYLDFVHRVPFNGPDRRHRARCAEQGGSDFRAGTGCRPPGTASTAAGGMIHQVMPVIPIQQWVPGPSPIQCIVTGEASPLPPAGSAISRAATAQKRVLKKRNGGHFQVLG